MNNNIQAVIFFIVFTFLSVLLFFFWINKRSKIANKRISAWLEKQNYILLDKKYKILFKGPFFKGSILFDMVYVLNFKDESGRTKRCWIKVGNRFIGLLSKGFRVYWKKF